MDAKKNWAVAQIALSVLAHDRKVEQLWEK